MSQIRSPRVGIVGAGLMGTWHAEAIRKAGGSLLGIADLDGRVAQRLARKYRSAEIFTDLEQMLNRIPLDVLHICTPAHTHQMHAERAIDADINLLIEKPVTQKGSDTERLLERAATRGVLLCPVHQFIFQDGVMSAKKSLRRIGQVVHLDAMFCSAGGVGFPDEYQDSVVADILSHPLSLMQLFLSDGVLPEDWITIRPRCGELRALGSMSEITLSVFISMHGRPTVCGLQIIGTNGTIHIDLFHGYSFLESGTVSKTKKVLHPFDLALKRLGSATMNLGKRVFQGETAYPGLQRLVTSFYDAIRNKAQSPILAESIIAVAHVRDVLIEKAGLVQEIKT